MVAKAKEQINSPQNSTDYEPTPGELKLLEVLLDPDNRNKSKTEICRIAGLDRQTYYNAYKKPEFRALITKTSKDLVLEYVLPTIHAFAKFAQTGSYQHGEALLEMAELLKKTTRLEHTGADGKPIETVNKNTNEDYSHMSDAELDIEIAKLEAMNKGANKGLKPNGNKPSNTASSTKQQTRGVKKTSSGKKTGKSKSRKTPSRKR